MSTNQGAVFFIFEAVRQAKCNACLPFKNERIKNGDEPPR